MSKFAIFNEALSNKVSKSADNELTTNIDTIKVELADLITAHGVTQMELAETRQQVADLIRYINELTNQLDS
jgi:hypothetical protein